MPNLSSSTDSIGERRHAARIALTKTRYAAEFFESLFGRSEARTYLRRLAAIQEALGEDNDRRAAERLLGEVTMNDAALETPGSAGSRAAGAPGRSTRASPWRKKTSGG